MRTAIGKVVRAAPSFPREDAPGLHGVVVIVRDDLATEPRSLPARSTTIFEIGPGLVYRLVAPPGAKGGQSGVAAKRSALGETSMTALSGREGLFARIDPVANCRRAGSAQIESASPMAIDATARARDHRFLGNPAVRFLTSAK